MTSGRPALPVPHSNDLLEGGGGTGLLSAKCVISGRLACRNSSTGLVEIGFTGTAGILISSPRSKRRRLSGCAHSISSPSLTLDSRLLRLLVVRGSALVDMVYGPLISTASLLGLAGVGAVF